MNIARAMALGLVLVCWPPTGAVDLVARQNQAPKQTDGVGPSLLGPPNEAGGVVVRARFELHDINEINDESETFEFSGVLTLEWRDPRQAFDPAVVGVNEKVFQGGYQFAELAAGWYPQTVLVNESGLYEKSGVVLRIQPDGTSTVTETINAVAESEVNMALFPFDRHRLEAAFEVLGFGNDEVVFQVDSDSGAGSPTVDVRVPQWTIGDLRMSVRDRPAPYAGRRKIASTVVVSVDVQRQPLYAVRLVVFPLIVIVLLSFSVFWMDHTSESDRTSISFIGILTGVAYLLTMSDQLPHISYFTLMHGFINLSFLTMCATVVINLAVGAHDRRGRHDLADRIDRRCRWAFPLVYVCGLLVILGAGLVL